MNGRIIYQWRRYREEREPRAFPACVSRSPEASRCQNGPGSPQQHLTERTRNRSALRQIARDSMAPIHREYLWVNGRLHRCRGITEKAAALSAPVVDNRWSLLVNCCSEMSFPRLAAEIPDEKWRRMFNEQWKMLETPREGGSGERLSRYGPRVERKRFQRIFHARITRFIILRSLRYRKYVKCSCNGVESESRLKNKSKTWSDIFPIFQKRLSSRLETFLKGFFKRGSPVSLFVRRLDIGNM